MKLFFTTFHIVLFSYLAYAQQTISANNIQMVSNQPLKITLSDSSKTKNIRKKGDFYMSTYSGLSLLALTSNRHYALGGSALQKSIIVGIVTEHMRNEIMGIGLELGYNFFEFARYNNNPNIVFVSNTHFIRTHMRFNFHLSKNKHWDFYPFCSIGLDFIYYGYNGLNNQANRFDINLNNSFNPFSGKMGLGLKYFPVKRFGIYSELAIGNPFFLGGICYKFK